MIETSDELADKQMNKKSLSFAEKILLKQGWKSGEGLGKNSQGISEPIKATLKFDKAGVGHDPAKEFTSSWWDDAYKKAANNVIIDSVQDGTVTVNWTKTSKEKKSSKIKNSVINSQYSAFVQSATLDGGKLISKKEDESDEDSDTDSDITSKNFNKLTDDELFKAVGGLTAHKGARHGHKMSAKQKRIELQEKELMMQMKKNYKVDKLETTKNNSQSKFEPRNDNERTLIVDQTSDKSEKRHKKKKEKHQKHSIKTKETDISQTDNATSVSSLKSSKYLEKANKSDENMNCDVHDKKSKKKKKKSNSNHKSDDLPKETDLDKKAKKKHKTKKKRSLEEDCGSLMKPVKKIKCDN